MKYSLYFFILFILTILSCQSSESNYINIGEKIEIYSTTLEENREIYIHQPKGFWGMDENMENLPVVIVLDGESQFLNTVSTIDFLSSAPNGNDFLPRSIIVGIPNTNRNRDLTPIQEMLGQDSIASKQTGGGPKFLEFITNELIPYIDNKYSTCSHRTIIGHSLGGLMSFEALLEQRNYFNNYIAIDPAFGFANESYLKQVLDTLESADLSNENLYVAVANNRPTFLKLEELLDDSSEMLKMMDIPNRKLINLSESNSWPINISLKYYPNENHFSIPHQATYDAMKHFYNYYSFKDMSDFYHPEFALKKDLLEKLINHYKQISDNMECATIPMEGYINSFAFGLGHYGRNDLAIDLLEYNISLHPENPIVYNNLGYYYNNNDNKKKAIEQFNKSLSLQKDKSILELRNQLMKK